MTGPMPISFTKAGTAPGRVFSKNIRRARVLLEFFDEDTKGSQQPTNAATELLRSALIFAVGALDAYLHDLILEIVPAHAPHSPSLADILKAIAKEDPKLVLRIVHTDDKFARQREFRKALDDALSERSFLGSAGVKRALDLIDCRIDWPEFDEAAGSNIQRELSLLAQQRNNIVHRGWRTTTTRDEMGAAIALLETVGMLIDDRVCKQWGIPSMTV
jgi:hypothetical protein